LCGGEKTCRAEAAFICFSQILQKKKFSVIFCCMESKKDTKKHFIIRAF